MLIEAFALIFVICQYHKTWKEHHWMSQRPIDIHEFQFRVRHFNFMRYGNWSETFIVPRRIQNNVYCYNPLDSGSCESVSQTIEPFMKGWPDGMEGGKYKRAIPQLLFRHSLLNWSDKFPQRPSTGTSKLAKHTAGWTRSSLVYLWGIHIPVRVDTRYWHDAAQIYRYSGSRPSSHLHSVRVCKWPCRHSTAHIHT